MKKFILIIFLIMTVLCSVSYAEGKIDTLSKIENSVLGVDYSNQKTETRLNRLEEYVYGVKKTGSNNDRIKRLSKDLNADVIGQEIEPCEDTLAMDEENVPDSSVDYPVIDEVEKHLSIKNTQKQSLHQRIVTIEKRLFSKTYETDDFYTRVERIKGRIYKNDTALAKSYDVDDISIPEYIPDEDSDGFEFDDISRRRNLSRNFVGNNTSELSKLEQKILHKTYPDESANDRLARLENSLFDTDFYYDDESERINRLEGALKGQKSAAKYDNNKFQQGLNTALQIGAMVLMVLAFIL